MLPFGRSVSLLSSAVVAVQGGVATWRRIAKEPCLCTRSVSQIGGVAQQGHGHVQNTAVPPHARRRPERVVVWANLRAHGGFVRHHMRPLLVTRVCHDQGADLRSASLQGVGENVGGMGAREWDIHHNWGRG